MFQLVSCLLNKIVSFWKPGKKVKVRVPYQANNLIMISLHINLTGRETIIIKLIQPMNCTQLVIGLQHDIAGLIRPYNAYIAYEHVTIWVKGRKLFNYHNT